MSQNLKFFLFITGIILAIDLYTWQGVRFLSQNWSDRARNILKFAYWGYTALNFTFFLAWRMNWIHIHPSLQRVVLTIVFVVFLAKLMWVIFLLMDDAIRLVRWVVSLFTGKDATQNQAPAENGISRLRFLNYIGFGVGGTFMLSAIYGITRGAHKYTVHRKTLAIKGLPKAFEGLTIAQISDVHSGSFWDTKAVKRGIDMLRDQKTDLIFFTGDLVNDISDEAVRFHELYSTIKAPLGVYSILGNHDYGDYYQWPDRTGEHLGPPRADKGHMSPLQKANLEKLISMHKGFGWNLLLDEHKIIEKDGERMAIIGVENWSTKARFPKYGNLAQAYEGAEDAGLKLLLSHDPSHWRGEVLEKYKDIQATFSGHTHGMQFGVDTSHYRWSPVKLLYPEWIDLYTENDQHLYVNRGFGYLGFPGRIGIFPEITVFTLRGA